MMITPSVLKLIHDQQEEEFMKHIELDKFTNNDSVSTNRPIFGIKRFGEWLKGRFSTSKEQKLTVNTVVRKSQPASESNYAKTCNPC